MHRKFDFSTQGCAILFTHITTLILPDQTLDFFDSNSIPSPIPLVATSSPLLVAYSNMNLSLFVTDHIRENP
jgi:hypothetical protein